MIHYPHPGYRRPGRRPRTGLLWVVLGALLLSACAAPAVRDLDPRTMVFPAVSFSPPRPERHLLSNEMVVFLLEDHELPLIQGRALIRAGSILDPPGQTGLASLCGGLLVEGGSAEFPGSLLDEVLEDRAINMGSGFSRQSGRVTVSALNSEWKEALRLFRDVLRDPAFHEEKFHLSRKKAVEGVIRTVDDPDDLTFREFRRLFYGEDPRGREPTVPELEGLTREDVVRFYRQYVQPDRIILGFVGDFESRALLESLETQFGDWEPSGTEVGRFPLPDPEAADRKLTFLDKDLPQATIVLGHFAPPKDSADYAPFMLADFILGGGGFNSRLMREIRSNRGLAYSVGSFYRGDIGYGVFVSWCKTKNETAAEALGMMVDLMGEMRDGLITEEELTWAREALINGMIFRYSSTAALLEEAMRLEYDHLPPEFIRDIKSKIQSATLQSVMEVAGEYFEPDLATTVILGKRADMTGAWPAGRDIRSLAVSPGGDIVEGTGP